MRTSLNWLVDASRGAVSPVYGSVVSHLPDWLTRPFGSDCGAALAHRPAELESDAAGVEETLPSAGDSRGFRPSPGADDAQNLIDEMLYHGRFSLLLRPQLVENLSHAQLKKAQGALADCMCLVPEGEVVVHRRGEYEAEADQVERPVRVEAYYLDRHAVTNLQFQQFVSQGGYEQMAIWDPEVWAAVLDFVDLSGHPGPRYWRNGKFTRGEEHHPVVGVSWYEAAAYARWAGKRLPTDAEWVKAASWPVSMPGHPLLQRRYPWGEAIDRDRANLWGSGPGRTVSVDQFPRGVSVGGAQQLIGNVWEWTADLFAGWSDDAREADPSHPKMNALRGGAFDTYLDCQSTCHFQSGDWALARKHNIGFRAAISACDVFDGDSPADASPNKDQTPGEAHV